MSEPHPPSQVLPPSDGEGVAAPKYLRAQERRAATIEAVLQLAACTHPSELSTTRIAQHMGVTQGALFKHFPSKEALLEATMAWVAQQLLARIEQAAQEPLARGDCLAALQAVFLAHIGFAAEHPGVPRILFGELQRSESSASRQVVQNLLGQYAQRLQQWLAQGQAQGQVAPGTDLAAASALLVGMVQGLVMQSVLAGNAQLLRTQAPAVFALYRRAIAASPALPCPPDGEPT